MKKHVNMTSYFHNSNLVNFDAIAADEEFPIPAFQLPEYQNRIKKYFFFQSIYF